MAKSCRRAVRGRLLQQMQLPRTNPSHEFGFRLIDPCHYLVFVSAADSFDWSLPTRISGEVWVDELSLIVFSV